jgi:hypothetical protein
MSNIKFTTTFAITVLVIWIVFLKAEGRQNIFSFSENKFNTEKRKDYDTSKQGSDGPIIVYENGDIKSYSIVAFDTAFKISKRVITKADSLFCYVDETGQKFGFQLKDTIKCEIDTFALPDKMLIISDIHGNFKGLQMILTGAGVLNNNLNWFFGKGHLVIEGDFFDRGINVTECLWLIYKLEKEAEKCGGKVHLILGNHEIMNMKGSYRDVRYKYFINSIILDLNYKNWYSSDSELGRWLRSKNSIEKIGNFLFLHGGISKDFPKGILSITEINDSIRAGIDKNFSKGELSKNIFLGNSGPLWYRGLVKETENLEEIEQTLKSLNAVKMILGHTIVDKIKYLYKEYIIAVNVDHQINTDKGLMFALWFENNTFSIIDAEGNKTDLK